MKVEFHCAPHLIDAIPHPVRASKAIPEYYKNLKSTVSGEPDKGTLKRCVPFLEALSAGYIIPLWADVFIRSNGNELNVMFPPAFQQDKMLEAHQAEQVAGYPLSNLPYGNIPLKLMNPWIVKTPPGVSCIFTQPLNHLETRIKLFDGIVDTDNYYHNVNLPFVVMVGDGEYFIPKGTPIVQIIPIRREKLSSSVGEIDKKKNIGVLSKISTTMAFGYKNMIWHGRAQKKAGWLSSLLGKSPK